MADEYKVLICDDSILARKRLKNLLASSGVEAVFEAANGQEAIDKYKEHMPNAVFMDIVMPVKDGIQAVTEIMEFDKNANIIMVSSVGTQEYLKHAIKAGASDFLQKPIEEDKFAEFMLRLTGR
ncbi:MAG: response regulator [Lachnospiraceae bacterium]